MKNRRPAGLLYDQGQYAAAEPLFRRAIVILEKNTRTGASPYENNTKEFRNPSVRTFAKVTPVRENGIMKSLNTDHADSAHRWHGFLQIRDEPIHGR